MTIKSIKQKQFLATLDKLRHNIDESVSRKSCYVEKLSLFQLKKAVSLHAEAKEMKINLPNVNRKICHTFIHTVNYFEMR